LTRLRQSLCALALSTLAAAGLARVVPLAGQTPAPQLALLTADGRRPIPAFAIDGQDRVALDDLAPLFQLAVRDEAGAITVSFDGRTAVLTPNRRWPRSRAG
jgi:hypothetical protein